MKFQSEDQTSKATKRASLSSIQKFSAKSMEAPPPEQKLAQLREQIEIVRDQMGRETGAKRLELQLVLDGLQADLLQYEEASQLFTDEQMARQLQEEEPALDSRTSLVQVLHRTLETHQFEVPEAQMDDSWTSGLGLLQTNRTSPPDRVWVSIRCQGKEIDCIQPIKDPVDPRTRYFTCAPPLGGKKGLPQKWGVLRHLHGDQWVFEIAPPLPAELFGAHQGVLEYAKFDERGIPTYSALGVPLSKSLRKKLEIQYEIAERDYTQFMEMMSSHESSKVVEK
jgi:hypothetical protein